MGRVPCLFVGEITVSTKRTHWNCRFPDLKFQCDLSPYYAFKPLIEGAAELPANDS